MKVKNRIDELVNMLHDKNIFTEEDLDIYIDLVSDKKGITDRQIYADIVHFKSSILEGLSRYNFTTSSKKEISQGVKGTDGIKESNGKIDYSEINLKILDLMAERFTANKHKYPKGNMKKNIDIKSLEWALFRHVKKMVQPIETDEETYKDHLSAVLCNASMILDQLKNNV